MKKTVSTLFTVAVLALMMISTAQAANYLTEDPENPGQPYVYPEYGFQPWSIYKVHAPGLYSVHLEQANDSDFELSTLTCTASEDALRESLLTVGMYAGNGTSERPNIHPAGGCRMAPHGETYMLGNLLNFMAMNADAEATAGPTAWGGSGMAQKHVYIKLESF